MKKVIIKILALFLLTFYLTLLSPQIIAQISINTNNNNKTEDVQKENVNNQSYPVILDGNKLFTINNNFGPISAQERAKNISKKLKKLAEDPLFIVDTIEVTEQDNLVFIYAGQFAGDTIILTLTQDDIQKSELEKKELTEIYIDQIGEAINNYRQSRESINILQGVFYSIIVIVILVVFLFLINFTFNLINNSLNNNYTNLSGIKIRGIQILTGARLTNILQTLTTNSQFLLNFASLIIATILISGFFPATKRIGLRVWSYCLNSLISIYSGFIDYLPNLFFIFIISLLTYYFLRFIKPIFSEIEKGSLSFSGFYPEWAEPTYRLIEIFIFAVAAIMIFPYLPGFGSAAFQNVSLLLGVLVSLGSTSAVSNAVAGIILIYTRAFQIGDRVKLSHHLGDIEEKSLLVTRIRTFENVIITVPNSSLLNSEIINYSASVRETRTPVMLTAIITLGYDVPWEKVYETLVKSALNTQYILESPLPFVLQTSLGDFSVTYELKAYTNYPTKMEFIYSELHQNMQDQCNEADIEILSPTYSAIRDGNMSTIPEQYLGDDYSTSGFQLNPIGNLFQIDLNLTPNRQSNSKK